MTTTARKDRELAAVQLDKADPEAVIGKAVIGKVVVDDDAPVDGKVVEGDGKKYDTVELTGEKFRLREKIGAIAMLKWGAASEMDTDDPRALGAIYAMLKSVILKEDWHKFEDHALDSDADAEALLDVVTGALETISGRPTAPSSAS